MFSRDVTAAMLVFLNNGTVAMLVSPTNPPGIQKNKVTDHVSDKSAILNSLFQITIMGFSGRKCY